MAGPTLHEERSAGSSSGLGPAPARLPDSLQQQLLRQGLHTEFHFSHEGFQGQRGMQGRFVP